MEIFDKSVTRDNDLKRLAGTLENLRKKAGLSSQSTTQITNEAQPQPMQPNYRQG